MLNSMNSLKITKNSPCILAVLQFFSLVKVISPTVIWGENIH